VRRVIVRFKVNEHQAKEKGEMGKVVITEFVSLDGVVEDPGGHEGFRHGGWSFEINRGEDGDRFRLDEALGTEALLMGRRDLRVPRRGVAIPGCQVGGQVEQHAQVRRVLDPRGSRLEQLDRSEGDVVNEVRSRSSRSSRGDWI
jgi:hypothetical protein